VRQGFSAERRLRLSMSAAESDQQVSCGGYQLACCSGALDPRVTRGA
jgi:hypothetical protein